MVLLDDVAQVVDLLEDDRYFTAGIEPIDDHLVRATLIPQALSGNTAGFHSFSKTVRLQPCLAELLAKIRYFLPAQAGPKPMSPQRQNCRFVQTTNYCVPS